jgi:hypothetical protein
MRRREGMEVTSLELSCYGTKPGFGDPLVIYRRLTALVLQNDTLSC